MRTESTRSVGEYLFGQDTSHAFSDAVLLDERFTLFPAVNDSNDYRVSFDLSLTARLNQWLQWNVALADRYLHIPPAGGAVQNDTSVSTGLGIVFGNGSGGGYTGADGRRPATPRR